MENNICIHQSSGFATHATTLEEKILTQTVSSEHQTLSSELNILTSEHQTASS